MAVVSTVDGQLIPFPVIRQQRSLEIDGLLYARDVATGDATGGSVQVQVRAPTSHLYRLRAFSAVAIASATPSNFEVLLRATHLGDQTTFAASDFLMLGSQAEGPAGSFKAVAQDVKSVIDVGQRLFLGSVRPIAVSANLLFVWVWSTNVNLGSYTLTVVFDAFRREALGVPGFLEGLRPGLVR